MLEIRVANYQPSFSETQQLQSLSYDYRFDHVYFKLGFICDTVYDDQKQALFWFLEALRTNHEETRMYLWTQFRLSKCRYFEGQESPPLRDALVAIMAHSSFLITMCFMKYPHLDWGDSLFVKCCETRNEELIQTWPCRVSFATWRRIVREVGFFHLSPLEARDMKKNFITDLPSSHTRHAFRV